jgi:hypothetical protein
MDAREDRVDRNEAASRVFNTRIQQLVAKLRRSRDFQVICECGDYECNEQIHLSPAEYDDVRSDARRAIVVAGHENLEIEQVVSRHPSYLVVEPEARESTQES